MQSLTLRSSRVAGAPCAQTRRSVQHVKPVLRALATGRASSVRVQAANFSPCTVAETKARFIQAYKLPISNLYNTVLQELLVQMHFIRYSIGYNYNEVYALGFVSVFDQIMEAMPEDQRKLIFTAYVKALQEDPEQYRRDAANLEKDASSLTGPEALTPDASGTALQAVLARLAEQSAAGKLQYSKFFAIGLFRLLELTGAKEPAALERLVKAVGAKPEAVNRDLMLYKGILSKLSAAKELMKEFLEREKRKQAEREAAKAQAQEKETAGSTAA